MVYYKRLIVKQYIATRITSFIHGFAFSNIRFKYSAKPHTHTQTVHSIGPVSPRTPSFRKRRKKHGRRDELHGHIFDSFATESAGLIGYHIPSGNIVILLYRNRDVTSKVHLRVLYPLDCGIKYEKLIARLCYHCYQ